MANRPAYRVPLVAEAPAVDGVMDEAYNSAAAMRFRFLNGRPDRPNEATTVHALSTATHLYVFFQCQSADTANLRATVTRHDDEVWRDDSVEMFLDPSNLRRPGGYFHIIINSLGATTETRGGKGREDPSWDPKLQVKTKVEKTVWTVEAAIPLADLAGEGDFNRVWAANFNRMAYAGEGTEDTAWSPTGSENSHDADMFGSLWLDAGKVYPADYARWTAPRRVYTAPETPVFQVAPADPRTVAKVKEVTPNADNTWCFGTALLPTNSEALVIVGPERSVQITTIHGWRPITAAWLNAKVLLVRRGLDEHEGYYCIYDVQRNKVLIEELENDGAAAWERLTKPATTQPRTAPFWR